MEEEDLSNKYKNQIFSKYPESSYANVILDPDYNKKLQEEARQASDLYSKTYDAYQQGQYYRVKMNADKALELYAADTALAPRFALLSAIARGRLETIDTMAYALLDVVRTYPNSGIHNYASELLRNINEEYNLGLDLGNIASTSKTSEQTKLQYPYTLEPNAKHFVMIVFDPKKIRVEPLKVRISDFNKKEFRFKEFEVKNIMLDDNRMLLTLGLFDSEQEAKDYITAMMLSDYLFGGIDKDSFSVLPISVSNYAVFYREKNLEVYKGFLNGDDPNVVMAPKTIPDNAEKKGGGDLKGGDIKKGGGDASKGEAKKGGEERKGGTDIKPEGGSKSGTTLNLNPGNKGDNKGTQLNDNVKGKKLNNNILKKG